MVDHTKMRNVRGMKTLYQITHAGAGRERVRHISLTPRVAQALAHAHARAHAHAHAHAQPHYTIPSHH